MSVLDVGINGRGKMSERANELFRFRDDLKRVLGQDWSEATKREIQERFESVEYKLTELSRSDRQMNDNIGRDVVQQYKNNEFYMGRF